MDESDFQAAIRDSRRASEASEELHSKILGLAQHEIEVAASELVRIGDDLASAIRREGIRPRDCVASSRNVPRTRAGLFGKVVEAHKAVEVVRSWELLVAGDIDDGDSRSSESGRQRWLLTETGAWGRSGEIGDLGGFFDALAKGMYWARCEFTLGGATYTPDLQKIRRRFLAGSPLSARDYVFRPEQRVRGKLEGPAAMKGDLLDLLTSDGRRLAPGVKIPTTFSPMFVVDRELVIPKNRGADFISLKTALFESVKELVASGP